MSVSSNAPAQPTLPRRASVETLAGLRCALVGETDSTFACPICSRVLRLPQLTDCCGNHFCTSCLSRWLQVSSSCPLCRQVGFKSIRDKKIERAVQDMEVYCHHEGSGCTWRGRLCDVDSHLASSCPRVLIGCPKDCGEVIPRESIQSHIENLCPRRSTSCTYCNMEGPMDFITKEHHNICPKVLLACPNQCPVEKILREDMAGHLQECPLQVVECAFRSIGCGEAVVRRDLDSHMSFAQSHHLLLAVDTIADLNHELEAVKEDLVQFRGELEMSRMEIESLRMVGEAIENQQQQAATGGGGGVGGGGGGGGREGVLISLGTHRLTGRLLMEKHLEASAQICQQDPFLPFVVKMDDFSYYSTHREPWYSPPFYSEPLGYKLCLCVYANGICSGQSTHLSVYIHLMAGEFDDSQEWPLQLTLTIELQNQLADKNHWRVDCEFGTNNSHQTCQRVARGRARRGAGTATLIRLEELGHNTAFSNCHYLRNNRLFFAIY